MFDSPTEILSVLETYKYLIVFPLTIIEGPIISIISGFLIYLGIMDFWIALPVLVVADMLGDCGYHIIGRYWRQAKWARRYAGFLGYSEHSEVFLEEHFRKHKFKTFLFAKFAHGLGAVIQIASGIAKVNFLHFILFSFFSTIPKILILVSIGFYAGSSIARIDGVLSTVALVVFGSFVFLIISYILLNKYMRKFFTHK